MTFKCSYLLGKLILLLVVLQLISVMQLSAANNSNSNSNSGNSRSGNNNDSSNSSNNKGNNSNGNNSNSNSNSTSSRGNSSNNNGNSNSRSGNSNSNSNSGSNRGNNGKGGNSASATTAGPKNADYDKIIRALCVNDLPQDKHDAFNKCLDILTPSLNSIYNQCLQQLGAGNGKDALKDTVCDIKTGKSIKFSQCTLDKAQSKHLSQDEINKGQDCMKQALGV